MLLKEMLHMHDKILAQVQKNKKKPVCSPQEKMGKKMGVYFMHSFKNYN